MYNIELVFIAFYMQLQTFSFIKHCIKEKEKGESLSTLKLLACSVNFGRRKYFTYGYIMEKVAQ